MTKETKEYLNNLRISMKLKGLEEEHFYMYVVISLHNEDNVDKSSLVESVGKGKKQTGRILKALKDAGFISYENAVASILGGV